MAAVTLIKYAVTGGFPHYVAHIKKVCTLNGGSTPVENEAIVQVLKRIHATSQVGEATAVGEKYAGLDVIKFAASTRVLPKVRG
jgi:hypothetical protein